MTAMALPQPETIGDRVRYMRWNVRHLSQRSLADATGNLVREPTIMRIESGQQVPRFDELVILAAALDVTVLQLGATAEDYPVLGFLTGFDPAKVPAQEGSSQIRWRGDSASDLLVPARVVNLATHLKVRTRKNDSAVIPVGARVEHAFPWPDTVSARRSPRPTC